LDTQVTEVGVDDVARGDEHRPGERPGQDRPNGTTPPSAKTMSSKMTP
jgi:hypothetical protein